MELYKIHSLVLQADLDGVKAQLAQGVDLDELDENGQTPLHWAVLGGYDDIVQALLEAGANPNSFSGDGVTPKWRARDFGLHHIEVLLATYGGKVLTNAQFNGPATTIFYEVCGLPLPEAEE